MRGRTVGSGSRPEELGSCGAGRWAGVQGDGAGPAPAGLRLPPADLGISAHVDLNPAAYQMCGLETVTLSESFLFPVKILRIKTLTELMSK